MYLSIMKQNIFYFNSSFLLFRIRMGFWESSLTTQIFCIQKAIRIPSFKSLSTAWPVSVLAETWQSYSGLTRLLPSLKGGRGSNNIHSRKKAVQKQLFWIRYSLAGDIVLSNPSLISGTTQKSYLLSMIYLPSYIRLIKITVKKIKSRTCISESRATKKIV